MGSGYSRTNLGSDCAVFDAGPSGTVVRWRDSFEVSMGNWKETNDDSNTSHTHVWGVQSKIAQKRFGFQLKASHDNNGVESIHVGLTDSADNETSFALEIRRDGHDGFRGGITGINSSGTPMSFTIAKENYSIETTILSYSCSQRDCHFVIEMKKKVNSENADMVTLAHYYLTKDAGLSVAAKIRPKEGNGFGVEVEGPFKHPSSDLRMVFVQTCRTGVWIPTACSHCAEKKPSDRSTPGYFRRCFKPQSSPHSDNILFSSHIDEQSNIGLINSSGYTKGSEEKLWL